MSQKLALDLVKLLALFAILFLGFKFWNPDLPGDVDFNLSLENEDKLGEIIAESFENDPKFQPLLDDTLEQVVQTITDRVTQNIGLSDYDVQVKLTQGEDVNAFTIPGGRIYVMRGLLEFADSPEEVAAVIAHEIGHVEQRHVVKRIAAEFGLALLTTIVAGGDQVMIGEISKSVVSATYGRGQERDADSYGLELLEKSSISPRAMAAFFRKLNREQMDYDERMEIIASHPHNNFRIKASMEYKTKDNFTEEPIDVDWILVKNRLL